MATVNLVPDEPQHGVLRGQQVKYGALWAWIRAYTVPAGRHLAMRLVPLPGGYTRRLYLDNSSTGDKQGQVMVYETHHPTDQAQHSNWLVFPDAQ